MTKKEIYKNYPLISTARDLNKERGMSSGTSKDSDNQRPGTAQGLQAGDCF